MNPVMRIGPQVEEALRVHTDLSAQERRQLGSRDAAEQGAAREDGQVHISSCFVVGTTYLALSV